MATDPKTIININQDPSYGPQDTSYAPSASRTDPVTQTITIQYTNPPLYGVPELQIFNDPGGNSNGVVQFNQSNRFGGDNSLRWDSKNRTLNILGNIRLTGDFQGRIITSATKFKLYGGEANNILTTDGAGNISWANLDGLSYGNAEVANFLPTYTGDFKNSSIIAIGNVAPNASISGKVWFNTDEGRSYISYQNSWVDSNPILSPDPDLTANTITFPDGSVQTTAFNGIIISNTQPVLGKGNVWFDEDEGRAYINYDGENWIDLSPVIPQDTDITANTITFLDGTVQRSANIWTNVPQSNTSPGVRGQLAYDGSNLYVCVAENTWGVASLNLAW